MSRPRAVPFKAVWAGLAALVLLVVLGGVYVYFRHVRYERVAIQHVPPDSSAVLRLDVERILLFEPVRQRILPLISRLRERPGLPPRLGRIEQETGLRLGIQLRELVVALGPARDDWLVVLGGLFPDADVAAGIRHVLEAEGHALEPVPGADAFARPQGWAFGQAGDGTLVVASSAARLRAALLPSDGFRRLGISGAGAGAFVLTPGFDWFGVSGLEGATGTLGLGAELAVDARIRVRPGLDSQLALALAALDVGSPRVRVLGPGQLEVHMDLTSQQLDLLAQRAADRVLRAAQ